jgi:hypothetical protein
VEAGDKRSVTLAGDAAQRLAGEEAVLAMYKESIRS